MFSKMLKSVPIAVLVCFLAVTLTTADKPEVPSADPSANTVKTSAIPGNAKALLEVARQIVSRSASVSEVLTLNLTNLLILLVLKAIALGIGFFYFGGNNHGGGYGGSGYGGASGYGPSAAGSYGYGSGGTSGYARSADGTKSTLVSESEVLMILTYLMGSSDGNYECMYRVACEDPTKAKDYLTASKMLMKGAKLFKRFVPYNSNYEHIVYGLQQAVEHKQNGGDCKEKYECSDVPSI